MIFKESVKTGLKELWANKLSSSLNILAIIISIIALNVMMAIMAGIEDNWLRQLHEAGGIEKATVTSKKPVVDGEERADLQRDFVLEDAALIKKQSPFIRYASPQIAGYREIRGAGLNKDFVEIIGGTRDLLRIYRQTVAKGRPITDQDVAESRPVCVIGTGVGDRLFGPRGDPLGKTIDIGGQLFEVAGLLKHNVLLRRGVNLLNRKNQTVYVPIATFQKKLEPASKISEIQYAVRERRHITAARIAVTKALAARHGGAEDFEISTQEEAYLKNKKAMDMMRLKFSLIAGISLIVGGIGIMNIMLASVAQRVMEIGIRKAVGARPRDILTQFLVESVIVSALGGTIGILVSMFVIFILAAFSADAPPVLRFDALFLSALFSVLVGIFFGLYPAHKASRLDPVDALRYQ